MRRQSNLSASKKKRPCIGVDLLGSDTPPEDFSEAIVQLCSELPSCDFFLFLTDNISHKFIPSPQIQHVIVSEVIRMDEHPLFAIRKKKQSSISQGIKFLKQGSINAFVSAGNTGALLGSAKLQLANLPGIARPAFLTLLPTKTNPLAVLDVGATISCKAKYLLQYAKMGIAYQKTCGIACPRIGLLNIGAESIKGTPELRETHEKLQSLYRNEKSGALFVGNIEGKAVFEGNVDVLITDGFTGNIFLKTAEGIASFFLHQLKQELKKQKDDLPSWVDVLEKQIDSTEYPGAVLCGVEGIVVKAHGDSSPYALKNAVKGALSLLEHQFLEKIKSELSTKK